MRMSCQSWIIGSLSLASSKLNWLACSSQISNRKTNTERQERNWLYQKDKADHHLLALVGLAGAATLIVLKKKHTYSRSHSQTVL